MWDDEDYSYLNEDEYMSLGDKVTHWMPLPKIPD